VEAANSRLSCQVLVCFMLYRQLQAREELEARKLLLHKRRRLHRSEGEPLNSRPAGAIPATKGMLHMGGSWSPQQHIPSLPPTLQHPAAAGPSHVQPLQPRPQLVAQSMRQRQQQQQARQRHDKAADHAHGNEAKQLPQPAQQHLKVQLTEGSGCSTSGPVEGDAARSTKPRLPGDAIRLQGREASPRPVAGPPHQPAPAEGHTAAPPEGEPCPLAPVSSPASRGEAAAAGGGGLVQLECGHSAGSSGLVTIQRAAPARQHPWPQPGKGDIDRSHTSISISVRAGPLPSHCLRKPLVPVDAPPTGEAGAMAAVREAEVAASRAAASNA
jgi:hypothetical protein